MQIKYPGNWFIVAIAVVLALAVLLIVKHQQAMEMFRQRNYSSLKNVDTIDRAVIKTEKAPLCPESFSNKNGLCYFKLITPEIAFITTATGKTNTFIFSNINCNPAAIITCAVHATDCLFGFIFINHFHKSKTLTLFCFAVLNDPERFYRPKITKYSG